jgi:hypothetical protein
VNDSKTRDKARYYKHIAIFPDALPTVNCQQLIHGAIIDAYVEMLKDLTDEKLRDILKTTHPCVIMFPTQCEGMRHCMAVCLLDVCGNTLMESVLTNILASDKEGLNRSFQCNHLGVPSCCIRSIIYITSPRWNGTNGTGMIVPFGPWQTFKLYTLGSMLH